MRPEAWVFAGTVVTAGPAYVAFLLKKVHHQVNGHDETLSTMVFETSKAVGRIEGKIDNHITSHGGDGR